ncbi:MAG: ArsC/Spx/MgsR family protein [Blastocatellia bacterium]
MVQEHLNLLPQRAEFPARPRRRQKIPSREELTKLIPTESNLIRRPITRLGKRFVIGFDKEALGALVKT